jgi:hypothetical protein
MSDQNLDSIKRAALLRQIGITGVAALAGVAAVEDEADAIQHPFNLDISDGDSVGTLGRRHPATLKAAISMGNIQIVGALSEVVVTPGWDYRIFQVDTPYISGTDETGLDHGGEDGKPKKINTKINGITGYYVVVSSSSPITC